MKKQLSRRSFIKISGAGSAGLIAAGSISKLSGTKKSAKKQIDGKVKITPTYCEMCTFKCAGWVYHRD